MRIRSLSVLGLAVACLASLAQAQSRFPSRTIEFVVSYAPGGSTDLVARAVAQRFGERLGQAAVVLNRPGAGGVIGANLVARANPDGHTLYAGFTTEMAVTAQLSKNAKFTIDDFEGIAVTGIIPVMLIGSKNIRANTMGELIDELRASPGKYTYGGGPGSPSHILGAWLNRIRNLDVPHIPYRGGAQGIGDVSGGHINMFWGGVSAVKGAVDAGLVKAFAVTGDRRSSALPNVPTFKEAGISDFELDSWTVLVAPKGVPPDVLAVLKQETMLALNEPSVRAILEKQGVELSPRQDVGAFLKDEQAKFGRVVRELGNLLD